jgi:hypothetical protein
MIGVTEKALYAIQYDKIHGGSLTERSNLTKHMLMHTHEFTLYTQHVSCMHTSVAAPSNGHEIKVRSLTRGESQLQSACRQPTCGKTQQVWYDLVLH